MYDEKHRSINDLIQLLIKRGVKINDVSSAETKLLNINYYKIKEFAKPFYKKQKDGKYLYEKISFEQIINRFYQDKNLRIYLLHAIEKVEISFKTKVAYILGERYQAFGYLNFNNWCNKNKYCRYYINDKEKEMKRYVKKLMNRGDNEVIKNFLENNKRYEFPPIWMLVELLTFGDILRFYNLMSEKNRNLVSNYYDCTSDELGGWLKTLKFIRNFAAHNSNVIDATIRTTPKIRKEWKKYLFIYTDKNKNKRISNKIALVIFILIYLTKKINTNYGFGNIRDVFSKLLRNNDKIANKYGFFNSDLTIFSKNFELT